MDNLIQIILIVVVAYVLLGSSCSCKGMKKGLSEVDCSYESETATVKACGQVCKDIKEEETCRNSKRNCYWGDTIYDWAGKNGAGYYFGSTYNPPLGACSDNESSYIAPVINEDKREKKDPSDFITSDLDDYYS